eukprot:403375487
MLRLMMLKSIWKLPFLACINWIIFQVKVSIQTALKQKRKNRNSLLVLVTSKMTIQIKHLIPIFKVLRKSKIPRFSHHKYQTVKPALFLQSQHIQKLKVFIKVLNPKQILIRIHKLAKRGISKVTLITILKYQQVKIKKKEASLQLE